MARHIIRGSEQVGTPIGAPVSTRPLDDRGTAHASGPLYKIISARKPAHYRSLVKALQLLVRVHGLADVIDAIGNGVCDLNRDTLAGQSLHMPHAALKLADSLVFAANDAAAIDAEVSPLVADALGKIAEATK